jgi:phenylalanyl-tRNA synthetase beta chain
MEWSLHSLNQTATGFKITDIVNTLNLVGFEVDNIFLEKSTQNEFVDNVRILIKVPSNREDLLNENFLVKDLESVLGYQIDKNWEVTKYNYYPLLNTKYIAYTNYEAIKIKSSLSKVTIYSVQLEGLEGLNEKITPIWIQKKLKNFGYTPTGKIDDVLHLVQLEWGQSFDLNRKFNDGVEGFDYTAERITKPATFYLDDRVYNLPADTIVFLDNQGNLITFLGFMECKLSPIIDGKACLHALHYDIHKNPLQINPLSSIVSLRPLRNEFIQSFRFSFQRLLTIFEIIYSAKVIPKVANLIEDTFGDKIELTRFLTLRKESLKNSLNLEDWNLEIFKKAGLKILKIENEELFLEIPSHRNDLLREIDIIEEYSRFVGYKNVLEIKPKKNEVSHLEKRVLKKRCNLSIAKQFFLGCGFSEMMSSSIIPNECTKVSSINLANPLSYEFGELRTELLTGLIDIFETNLRLTSKPQSIFEIGRVFNAKEGEIFETDKLGAILYKEKGKTSDSTVWFEVKGLIETFLSSYGYNSERFEFIPVKLAYNILHKTRSVIITLDGKSIGIFGEISPSLDQLQTLKYTFYLFEVNLNYLTNWETNSPLSEVQIWPKRQIMMKDLSFKVNKNINMVNLKYLLLDEINYLVDVSYFDIYSQDEETKDLIDIGIRLKFKWETGVLASRVVPTLMRSNITTGTIEQEEKRAIALLELQVIFLLEVCFGATFTK